MADIRLEDLAEDTQVVDRMGDVGVVRDGWIDYPETAPLSLTYAQRFAPFTVVPEPGGSHV